MNIDTGSAIVGAIIITLCVLPFIIIQRTQMNKKKQILLSLFKIGEQHQCQITEYEALGDFAIGIDSSKDFVCFYKNGKDQVTEQFVNLNGIKNCKVITANKTFRNKAGIQHEIEKLELGFSPIARNEPEIKMEFFNSDHNMQLRGELQSIEKWVTLINQRLKADS